MEPMRTFSTATYFPSEDSLRRKRDAINNYTRMAGTIPVKPRHTITLTTALITPSLKFPLQGLESKAYVFDLYIPGMVPGIEKVLDKLIMDEGTHT